MEAGKQAVEAATAGHRVLVFSNRTLRTEAIKIFDRTFAITYALEGVAVFVVPCKESDLTSRAVCN